MDKRSQAFLPKLEAVLLRLGKAAPQNVTQEVWHYLDKCEDSAVLHGSGLTSRTWLPELRLHPFGPPSVAMPTAAEDKAITAAAKTDHDAQPLAPNRRRASDTTRGRGGASREGGRG